MIPLFHDFTDATVLVFGGGSVGARKARRFAREARVVVVSPAFADESFGGADRVRAAPGPEEIPAWVERLDPALVVAATDDGAVNDAAAAAAREQGSLVNRADRHGDRDASSVVVPATATDGPVTVAVGTGGTSPAVSRHLRQRFEEEFAGAGAVAELTAGLRERLRETDVAPETRREAVRAVAESDAVWKSLRTGTANAETEAARVVARVLGWSPDDARTLVADRSPAREPEPENT